MYFSPDIPVYVCLWKVPQHEIINFFNRGQLCHKKIFHMKIIVRTLQTALYGFHECSLSDNEKISSAIQEYILIQVASK